MKIIKGDLIKLALQGKFDVIIQGCNCFCTMGTGIAKTIKYVFPEAYAIDLKTSKGSIAKLGTISYITVIRGGCRITIINGYTQYHYSNVVVSADCSAIGSVMKHVKIHFSGKRIGYPKIGAGKAKGDWRKISKIIDEELVGEDHTLVEFVSS